MRRSCPPRALLLATALVVGALALTGAATAQTTILVYDGDEISLSAGEGQVIRGQTSLEPGTTVQVRIQSEKPSSPFLSRPEARSRRGRRIHGLRRPLERGTRVDRDGLGAPRRGRTGCRGRPRRRVRRGCKPAATIDQQGPRLSLESGPGRDQRRDVPRSRVVGHRPYGVEGPQRAVPRGQRSSSPRAGPSRRTWT